MVEPETPAAPHLLESLILRRLRDLGVRIALDDVGTGYSSLSYLRQFPFDKVKIDKSFIGNQGDGIDGNAIIAAVTGLCRSLGIATTVEGVESETQLARVRAQGCDEAQGYLFSRPEPAHRLKEIYPAIAGSDDRRSAPGAQASLRRGTDQRKSAARK